MTQFLLYHLPTCVLRFGLKLGVICICLCHKIGLPFQDDPDQVSRTEDSIIAYSWNLYVEEVYEEPEVIVQFPMTKARTLNART